MTKPKEYWMRPFREWIGYSDTMVSAKDPKDMTEDEDSFNFKREDTVHLIEYSAYEALKIQLNALKDLEKTYGL